MNNGTAAYETQRLQLRSLLWVAALVSLRACGWAALPLPLSANALKQCLPPPNKVELLRVHATATTGNQEAVAGDGKERSEEGAAEEVGLVKEEGEGGGEQP